MLFIKKNLLFKAFSENSRSCNLSGDFQSSLNESIRRFYETIQSNTCY